MHPTDPLPARPPGTLVILGCGYVGLRVARAAAGAGVRVEIAARHAIPAPHPAIRAWTLDAGGPDAVPVLQRMTDHAPPPVAVLYSIPPLQPAAVPAPLAAALGAVAHRLVYLSSTAVYGELEQVDHRSPAVPCDDAGRRRLEAEQALTALPASSLVLRPAAIYGPGRGAHVLLRRGTLGHVRDVDKVVSRVHADDLAALCLAALASPLRGSYPVADDVPATTREVAAFCATLGLPPLPGVEPHAPGSSAPGRRVDGRRIRELLGVELRYPSYASGIPAALAAEAEPVTQTDSDTHGS